MSGRTHHERPNASLPTSSASWGNERIGRLPPFVWEDGERAIASLPSATPFFAIAGGGVSQLRDQLHEFKIKKEEASAGEDFEEALKVKCGIAKVHASLDAVEADRQESVAANSTVLRLEASSTN